MARTLNPASAHRVKMAARRRMTFGRTFIATLASGLPHHDTAKVKAFVKAAGIAPKWNVDAVTLNDVAIGIVTLVPSKDLPARAAL
jgi:hypothetical protein